MNKILPLLVKKLGSYTLRKNTEYAFRCGFCNDHRKRLDVNLKKGLFYCFHCRRSGIIQELLGTVGQEYSRKFVTKINLEKYKSQRLEECKMPKGFHTLTELFKKGEILSFLPKFKIERDLSYTRMSDYSWGYCEGNWRMKDRLIIPIIEDRKTVCWIARAVNGSKPKELSPEASLANKSHFLYNLDGISEGDTVLLVEGIFDAERMIQYGYKAVAALGSNLSDIQVGKLLAKKLKRIYIMFDGDSAGEKGTWDAFKKLSARTSSTEITAVVKRYPGRDPDELSKEEVQEIIR